MARTLPDPTHAESVAYVALTSPDRGTTHERVAVVDIAAGSPSFGQIVEHFDATTTRSSAVSAELPFCPAHNPKRAYGFVGVTYSAADLSASVSLRYLELFADGNRGEWRTQRVITIPPRAADPAHLPPFLREYGVVPPLITHVALSADDHWLYVSCWGSGELRRYDVTDPFNPALNGLVRLGGVVRRRAHPGAPDRPCNGGPHSIALSRDGRSAFVTNAFDAAWDDRCYPDGLRGWLVKLHALPTGLTVDPTFLVEFEPGTRPVSVRLRDPR